MPKGYVTKHTAKELQTKQKLANQNAGGGAAGMKDRLGGKAGHSKFMCYICKTSTPSLPGMKQHFESKHPKETMDESRLVDTHETFGGTTQGIAVKGTLKKSKRKDKDGNEIDDDEEED